MRSRQNQAQFLVQHALKSFAIILIVGTLIRTFLISSFVMSGQSMLPTIWPGDFLLGAKWRVQDLNRGEVVALRCPHDKDQVCLKRVIGLPGDRIEWHGGRLRINDDEALIWPEAPSEEAAKANTPPIVVPPQHVYLLNDKREVLEDSRSWGPIKTDLVEARILRVWLSLDWFEGAEVRSWPHLRFNRMFRSIN